jgi:hypothetical protein
MGLKIRISLVSVLALLLLLPSFSYATSHIVVIVNGEVLQNEVEPVIKNGVTLVPLRGIFELLGASVEWNTKLKMVTAKKDGTTVQLTIGSSIGYRNKEKITLEVEPQIIKGTTMVPLRFIGQAFGGKVQWLGETRSIFIVNGDLKHDPVIHLTQKNGNNVSTHENGSSFNVIKGKTFYVILDRKFSIDLWHISYEGTSSVSFPYKQLKNGDFLFSVTPGKAGKFELHVTPNKYMAYEYYKYTFTVSE